MVKMLNVFLSSKTDEFEKERNYLSMKISKIPYLECVLQEDKGPLPRDPISASLDDVRKCDMLVGILGDCDSDTTRKEIDEAINLGKYCLIYVKESETRSEKMSMFIQQLITQKVVYAKFKETSDLYSAVPRNVKNHISKILTMGLESFAKERQEFMANDKKTETETKRKIEKKNYTANDVLLDAKKSLADSDYLSSVIKCNISLELALRNWLIKTRLVSKQKIENQPMGKLIRIIHNKTAIDSRYIHNMFEISTMRSKAVHEAIVPSENSAKTAMVWTKELLEIFGA